MFYFFITAFALVSIYSVIVTWYVFALRDEKESVEGDLYQMEDILHSYLDELEKVYNMEIYYGNITLQRIIEKTKETEENVKKFNDLYFGEENFVNNKEKD